MLQLHHFTYGVLTPVLAYAMSFTGSLLGLICTARARGGGGRVRLRWLALGAVSIGGTGIWVMHFIAMLGFSISGASIRYDVPLTLVSAAIAVLVVGAGLVLVAFLGPRREWLLAGGVLTGGGVAVMHYTGMAAMHTDAHIDYDPAIVTLSVLIAVAAATAALWFALRVRGLPAMLGAAAIMGVAVSGMHYTGMLAMSAQRGMPGMPAPSGADAIDLLTPLIVGVSMVTAVLLLTIGVVPSEAERRTHEELAAEVSRRLNTPAAG